MQLLPLKQTVHPRDPCLLMMIQPMANGGSRQGAGHQQACVRLDPQGGTRGPGTARSKEGILGLHRDVVVVMDSDGT